MKEDVREIAAGVIETKIFIKPYVETDEKVWDEFVVNKSINGTFLQTRNFLNYHPEHRFEDASLIICNAKGAIISLCPACRLEQEGKLIFFSHKGSTFGGIIIDKKHYCVKYVLAIIQEIKRYLRENGYSEIYIKMTSDIFSQIKGDLFSYVFSYTGFEEYKELSTYIDYKYYKEQILSNFSQGKRTNVHNCEAKKLKIRKLQTDIEIAVFYDILCENLQKHGTKPVHTLQELLEFKNFRLIHECEFFGAYLEDEMLAGAMMFYFDKAKCAHTQYLCARQAYNQLSPLTYVYYSMIEKAKKDNYRYLSWGIATEDYGRVLNKGLIANKESYGSVYCNNLTYHIIL